MTKFRNQLGKIKQTGKRVLSIMVALLLIMMTVLPASSVAASSQSNSNEGDYDAMNAVELTAAMQPGWNMGNTLDATGGETSWGNPPATKELLLAIREEGFKSIRIPITWDIFIGGAPDFTINPTYLARVHEVIDWALEADFIVMMNLHHDSHWLHAMPENGEALITRFRAVWEQIAESFKDYPNQLIFEAINEPRFSDDWGLETDEFFEITDRLNNVAYDVIRAGGGANSERKIVMETLVAGITETKLERLKANIQAKNDPNLIASVHYYGIWPFSVNVAGKTRFTTEVSSDIDKQMKLLNDILVTDGIPVILGEYGLLGFDESVDVIQQGEKLKFFDYLVHTANQNQVVTMLWDNGQHYERNEHYWRDPMLHAVIMQAVSGRSSQTELDTLYIPQGSSEDLRVPLILNGNQLTAVAERSGRILAEGSDYELDGETLLLKSSLVSDLIGDQVGGEGGLLLSFNSGPDWEMTLIQTGEARLEAVKAKTYEFLIPAVLEGERVERVKAVSSSDASLSAQSWSPYLTYSEEYSVDYDEGLIRISAVPLNNFGNGDVYLTIEMWSGLKLPYVLTITDDGKYGVPGSEPAVIEPLPSETDEPVQTESSEDGVTTEASVNESNETSSTNVTDLSEGADETDDSEKPALERLGLIAAILGGLTVVGVGLGLLLKRKKDQK